MTLASFLAGFYLGGWFTAAIIEIEDHRRQYAGPSLAKKLGILLLWPGALVWNVGRWVVTRTRLDETEGSK